MADVELEAHFQMSASAEVQNEVLARARAVEERVIAKMVAAVIGRDASNFLRIRAEAEAKALYRMNLAMHAALADEGIVTYTGKIEG